MTIMISAQHHSEHLSEEALDDVLIGLGSTEAEAHLAACSQCNESLRQFRSSLHSFNQASLAWSESRPVPQAMTKAVDRLREKPRGLMTPLSWAMAAAVVAALAFQLWTYEFRQPATYPVATASQPADSEVQIAQDNQLLQSVNAALSASDVATPSEYGLQADSRSELKPPSRQRTRIR